MFAVGGCAYICMYEIYNSFFAEEPKNIVTYHNATSPDAESSQTVDKDHTLNGSDGQNSSGSDNVQDSDNANKNSLTDFYKSFDKYVVSITSSNYKESNGTIIAQDDKYLYIASCYSDLKSSDRFTIIFSDGSDCKAKEFRHDSVRNILIIQADIDEISKNTLSLLGSINAEDFFQTEDNANNTSERNTLLTLPVFAAAVTEIINETPIMDFVSNVESSIIAICKDSNNINIVSGIIKDELKVISYGKTDIEFFEVTFPDIHNLCGSLVITSNGEVIGIYSDTDTVTPIKDVYSLFN
ncbi:MAG: hypothetical protein IJZ25_04655 [Lachnospiraceae bacterium]|nr:hypothetical protein [Lachnospiraceae bacterium]